MSAPAARERRTVFEVEREQRWRIWLLFALLLALVLGAVWVACLVLAVITYLAVPVVDLVALLLRPRVVAILLGVSALVAVVYWFGAQVGARGRLLRALHGQPLDPGDRYHQRLADIVEELRLATGGPRIDCRVVATRGLNAFSFSDLHGGGVIGVTEGALARLSRQQLEAVVAHEFAQILSGTYVTVTVGCLLFGTSAALAEDLQDGMLGAAGTRAAPLALGVPLLGVWLWLLDLASSVVLAAVDRERQRQADTAAARYTHDPLSLAEALRIIARHPGGSGFVPGGLAALCIRGADDGTAGLRRSEPSLDERVAALLSLANAAPDEFERQVREADERFEDREHWASAPGDAASQPAAAQVTAIPAAEHVTAAALAAAAAAHGVAASLAAPAPAPASARGAFAGGACPSCGHSLEPADYEGVRVAVCRTCGGRLAGSDEVKRILARREVGFTAEQQHLADVLAADGDRLRRAATMARGHGGVSGVPCPRCGRTMVRGHYDYQYAVEVDRCLICDLIWFEKDELEALQILTERATG